MARSWERTQAARKRQGACDFVQASLHSDHRGEGRVGNASVDARGADGKVRGDIGEGIGGGGDGRGGGDRTRGS